jgi:hypothetical protein
MNKKHLLFIVFTVMNGYTQTLYIPKEYQAVYDEGSRSFDGKPGLYYWQNKSDYDINVNVLPDSSLVRGNEKIVYYNNSPDTLKQLVIRLYQNINRPGNPRDYLYDESDLNKGMVIISLTINGKEIKLGKPETEDTGTNLIIPDLKILPDEKTRISVSWEFTVTRKNNLRMGKYDPFSFFIAYWYPQVAVYDDIDGWDLIEYKGNTEFYNDFNNYSVKITVPNDYGVWATGDLENAEKVYSSKVFLNYKKALFSDKVINIIDADDVKNGAVLYNNSGETNTWEFSAEGVPDFTFGMSAHYSWDARSVWDGEKNVFVSAVYNPALKTGFDVCDESAKTIDIFAHSQPEVPFPYNKITLFNGDDGMESPMMVNMEWLEDHTWALYTFVHEIAHTYFPFYMGINERKYAWMDEGWAQMLSETPQNMLDSVNDFKEWNIKRYLTYAGTEDDLPIIIPSYNMAEDAYDHVSYFKTAVAYNMLKEMLDMRKPGLFKSALKEYMVRWHGKHPSPYDFFFTIDNAAGEDLGWFWHPWFFELGYPDLSIDSVFNDGGTYRVLISNQGIMPVPVVLNFETGNSSAGVFTFPPDIWKDGKDDIWLKCEPDSSNIKKITLGTKYIPDADSTNNVWIMK